MVSADCYDCLNGVICHSRLSFGGDIAGKRWAYHGSQRTAARACGGTYGGVRKQLRQAILYSTGKVATLRVCASVARQAAFHYHERSAK